jgi:hypothetical protein
MTKKYIAISAITLAVIMTFSLTSVALGQVNTPPKYDYDDRFDGVWELKLKGFVANDNKEKLQHASLKANWIINSTYNGLENVVFKTPLVKGFDLAAVNTDELRAPERGFDLVLIFNDKETNEELIVVLEIEDWMDHFVDLKKKGAMLADGDLINATNSDRYDIGMFGSVTPMSEE